MISLAIFGLVAIKATQAYRAGSLGLYATVMLSVALLAGALIGADLFLQKRRSTEWMTRFRKFAWGGFLVFGMVLIGTRISFESIQAQREGGFGAFAATLLSGALVTGAIIGADLFLQRQAQRGMDDALSDLCHAGGRRSNRRPVRLSALG